MAPGTCALAKPTPFRGSVSTGTGAEGHRAASCQSALGCPCSCPIYPFVHPYLQDMLMEKVFCPRPATPECYEKQGEVG